MSEYYTVIVNGKASIGLKEDLLRSISYFDCLVDCAVDTKIPITVPFDVELRHLTMLAKLLTGRKVTPKVDCYSHRDVLTVLDLAKAFSISGDVISAGFVGWVEHPNWIKLQQPEYLYLIYTINEDLVDFGRYFRQSAKVFGGLSAAMNLPRIRADPQMYIEMLLFFKNYNFGLCFGENNDKIQVQIDLMNAERDNNSHLFMINPHEPFLEEYFQYTPTYDDVWNNIGINAVPAPAPGENTLVAADIMTERIQKFTLGLLTTSPNPDIHVPFPFSNVAFAGGAVSKLLTTQYNVGISRQSDVDLFIFAKNYEERARIFEEVLNWFKTYNTVTKTSRTYYALRGSVTTIYIKDVCRKFQIISGNYSKAYDIISRFDLTHIQWCIMNDIVYGTPEACRSMREKMTRFCNIRRLRTDRLIKAIYCGYSIMKNNTVIESHGDITGLLNDSDSKQLTKYVRDLHGWYYPRSEPDMEGDAEKQHFLCMIEQDSKASLVTDDPEYVLNNVTISGNFENDYNSTSFSTFNQADIMNRVLARNVVSVMLRSKYGIMRLTTPIMKVTRISQMDNGITITSKPEDESFTEFCRNLETGVYRSFREMELTAKLMTDSGEITFVIPQYRINNQSTRGIPILRSQRGASMDIEEDLAIGDDLQILFLIEFMFRNDDARVNLKPIKLVKYQKYDPEAAAKIRAISEDIEKEIEQLAKESDFDSEIKYSDA